MQTRQLGQRRQRRHGAGAVSIGDPELDQGAATAALVEVDPGHGQVEGQAQLRGSFIPSLQRHERFREGAAEGHLLGIKVGRTGESGDCPLGIILPNVHVGEVGVG